MRKIKNAFTKLTGFRKLYYVCSVLTFLGIALGLSALVLAVLRKNGIRIPTLLVRIEPKNALEAYSYALCGIIATISLVSHTMLTVLISSSKNKTFGVELKEFLRNCSWRLRPFFVFAVSILAVIASVGFAVCEYPDWLFFLLIWSVFYIGCYTCIVWKLIINTEFAADFFKHFFERFGKKMVEEKKQVIDKILNQIVRLERGEQKYAIDVLRALLQNAKKETTDFFKKTAKDIFHQHLKQNNPNLEANVFVILCSQVQVENYDYCSLLIDTYDDVKATDKESKEKCLLLKRIRKYVCSSIQYKAIAEFYERNQMNEKQEEEYIRQFLRKSYTDNLDRDGFIFATRELEIDAKEMGINKSEIRELYAEIYEKLQNAAPEYLGKYDMGRHFNEFREVFFVRGRDETLYPLSLAWEIIFNYIKSIMMNPSVMTEKQIKMIASFVAAGLGAFDGRWKDAYIQISAYERLIRKAMIYCEYLFLRETGSDKVRTELFEAVLPLISRYESIAADIVRKIYMDLFGLLIYEWQAEELSYQEMMTLLKNKSGNYKGSMYYMIYKKMRMAFIDEADFSMHNEVLEYLNKSPLPETQFHKMKMEFKKKERFVWR